MQETQGGELAVIKPEQLSLEQKSKINELVGAIDINDSQAIIQYGVAAQSNISNFSDNVLSQIKSKDSGYVGDILTELMLDVKSLDVDALAENAGFLGKLFGSLKTKFQKFIAKYETLSVQIEKIVNELDSAKMRLLKDITLLDGMYDKNLEYLKDLDLYILAGSRKLDEINTVMIPKLKQEAEQSGDPVLVQKFKDLTQLANRFEKKLYDLKLSRMISIQTAPQLRIIQNNDQLLVEKIQSSILNTIPLWKNQIVIAISLFRQQKALEMQKKVSDTTNELLSKNAELLKENSLGVARESERGIVEIETLKKVHADLITTIEETLRIQSEGHTKRMQAETELVTLETDLKKKLTDLKDK